MGKKNQKNYSDDLKLRIVNARKVDKMSFGAIAKRFEVSKTAVYDIVKRFDESGSVESKIKGNSGRKSKVRLLPLEPTMMSFYHLNQRFSCRQHQERNVI